MVCVDTICRLSGKDEQKCAEKIESEEEYLILKSFSLFACEVWVGFYSPAILWNLSNGE